MKYIDVKVTIWNRIHFQEDADIQKAIAVIENEGIESVYDEALGFQEYSPMYETEENISPQDNEGNSTIEVYEDDKLLWENTNRSLFKTGDATGQSA